MASSLLTLLDDIATLLDDVALLTKIAAKKTTGLLGDDLAVRDAQYTVEPGHQALVVGDHEDGLAELAVEPGVSDVIGGIERRSRDRQLPRIRLRRLDEILERLERAVRGNE